jgi:2',3'-cyclic-nucleotide 2'-phosphodiesterase (5'-nucleotidase family)
MKKLLLFVFIFMTGMFLMSCDMFNQFVPTTTTTTTTTTELDTTTQAGTTTQGVTTNQVVTTTQEVITTQEITTVHDSLYSFSEVKSGTVGDTYTTRGTVVGLTLTGFLMEDDAEYMYVYLGAESELVVGDYVEVTGVTSSYGGAVQFTIGTVATKVSDGTVTIPTATTLDGTGVTEIASSFIVGEYIEVTGTVNVSGTYYNLIIDGTTVVGSLHSSGIDFTALHGQEVTVTGYVMYVSGSTTLYLNILVTEIDDGEITDPLSSFSEVRSGTVGDTYTTRGTVVGLTSLGFLIEANAEYMNVYLGAESELEVGDFVEVIGSTSDHGGAIQFTTDSVATKVSDGTVTFPTATVLDGAEVTAIASSFTVGEFVEVTGTVSVSGTYYNLVIDETAVVGSLHSSGIDFTEFDGEEVTVTGYLLYVAGSTTLYLNILVTDIEAVEITEPLDSFSEIRSGTVGDTYTTRGTIAGITPTGLLMVDNEEYMYVYLGLETELIVGDYVEVTGLTSDYGGAVQFTIGTVATKVSDGTVTLPTATVLDGTGVTEIASSFIVGEYIEVTGTVNVSGTYYNLIIDGTTVVGSLNNIGIDFTELHGEEVTVTGYVTYVSGSTTLYLSILVTEIGDGDLTEPLDSFSEIRSGTVGDTYTTRGTIAGVTPTGLLMEDNAEYMYVYLGLETEFEVGDYVEVTGLTSEYGGAVQFTAGSVLTKISDGSVTVPTTATVLDGTGVTVITSGFTVGEYIEVTGTVNVSDTYYNLTIEGTTVIGSLQNNGIDFTEFNEEEVTITGYMLFVSGSTTQYLTVLVTIIDGEVTEPLDSFSEIRSGTVGDTYTTRGTIAGITPTGLLMVDNEEYMYVYLGLETEFEVGDYVEVTGLTSDYGGAVQFTAGSVLTKISDGSVTLPTATVLDGTGVTVITSEFTVGEYVEVTGTVNVSGTYYNLTIEGTTVVGSLNNIGIDFTELHGEEVTVTGYVTYVSGSTTQYLSILVTEIGDGDVTEPLDSFSEIRSGTVGDTYTTRGTIAGITTYGLLMVYNEEYMYVYLGLETEFEVGDYVEVTGSTSEYGGNVQFTTDSIITKISDGSAAVLADGIFLDGAEVNEIIDSFPVGEYVLVTGTVSVSGTYYNLIIDGTTVIGSLHSSEIDFTALDGEEVTLLGHLLYVSGNTTQYLNILVTQIAGEIPDPSSSLELTILTVNDLHGYIEQDEYGTGGISNMAYLMDQIRNQNALDDVILIANGDMFQGTAISNMTNGLAVLECMNMMDFDAMGIGNHEFDWGIETVMGYFDGDETNGEADFPLLNGNVYLLVDDTLLAIVGGNMFEYTIIEKQGVQIGVISYVGDVYNSIAQNLVDDLYFDLDIAASVESIATDLKSAGVDIIVVNIHGGYSGNIESYYYNTQLAALEDANGDYLVDVVVNGHTHSYQTGSISRVGGSPLILIQSGGNGAAFGEIVLSLDSDTLEVTDYTIKLIYVSSAGTNYDQEIETYIEETLSDLGVVTLAVAGETINSTSNLFEWTGNVMLAATGADVAISNTGGVRSTGNVTMGEDVTLSQLYEISPFDNTLILMEVTYSELQEILGVSGLFYEVKDGVTIEDGQTYQVAIISYVYYYAQLEHLRTSEDIDTLLLIRDLLIEDIEIKGNNGELFSPISEPESDLEQMVDYSQELSVFISDPFKVDMLFTSTECKSDLNYFVN